MGGVCATRPTNPPRTSRVRSSRRPSTGRVSRTRPAPSCVSVIWPKRTVASYSFSPSAMNPATLVASPTQMGNTPVAVGSRVPVWPQRLTLKRPFTLRTTSNEVGPLGLLTTTTPEGSDMLERLCHFLRDERPDVLRVAVDGASRRVAMSSAAEFLRDAGDVDVAAGAEADVPGMCPVLGLAEARSDLDAIDRPGIVDETVREVEMRSRPRHHLARDGDGSELAALIELQGGQHLRKELHAGERLLLVDPDRHLPRIYPVLEKLGRHPQALRVGGRVPEAAGVGEDAGVDADRGIAAQRVTESLDDLVGEDADARGVGIDVVDVAERLGGEVVIEVEQDPAAGRRRDVGAEAIARPRVGRHGDVEGVVRGDLAAHLLGSGKEAEVVGQLVGVVDQHLAA